MSDLRTADVIFVSTHSQGSVVSTHILDRLIRDGHIRTSRNIVAEQLAAAGQNAAVGGVVNILSPQPQRVCCLALCGIHLGPLRYLSGSSFIQPYIQVRSRRALQLTVHCLVLFPCSTLKMQRRWSYLNSRCAGCNFCWTQLTFEIEHRERGFQELC
jgi:hypothetical protein